MRVPGEKSDLGGYILEVRIQMHPVNLHRILVSLASLDHGHQDIFMIFRAQVRVIAAMSITCPDGAAGIYRFDVPRIRSELQQVSPRAC